MSLGFIKIKHSDPNTLLLESCTEANLCVLVLKRNPERNTFRSECSDIIILRIPTHSNGMWGLWCYSHGSYLQLQFLQTDAHHHSRLIWLQALQCLVVRRLRPARKRTTVATSTRVRFFIVPPYFVECLLSVTPQKFFFCDM